MRAVRLLARVLTGAAGTSLGLRVGSRIRGRVGPVELEAQLRPARTGGTGIDLVPLGTAQLRTHRGPLRIDVRALDIDADRVPELLDPAALRTHAAPAAARLGRKLAARATLAGVGGAALTAAGVLRRPRDIAAAAALSAAGLTVAGVVAALTRDPDAWRDPELTGLLTRAPRILGDLRTAPERLAVYRSQLVDLTDTATSVYRHVLALPDEPPDDAIRLVHVSDLHLSPLGLPLAALLAERYSADAVVDTGDLVDWGTAAEERFAAQIATLDIPYLFVKGNHDSAGTAAAVARQPNAVVLDAADPPVHIAGLTFAGMADPRFNPDKTTGDDAAPQRAHEAGHRFAERLRDTGAEVDVALVHDPAAAPALAGLVPLVLAGHVHHRGARSLGETTLLIQGSTGGSGLRGVQHEPPDRLMVSVLHIDRATRRLWGVDDITVGGLGRTDVSVVRHRIGELLGAA